MFRNYLKITFRTILRNRVFALINILGLALGLTGFIFIALYVHYELSFDRHHHASRNIYRLALGPLDEGLYTYARTAAAMAPVLQAEYPGIDAFARFRRFPSLVSHGDRSFYENEFYFTDSSVFRVFSFDFIAGNPSTALVSPNSLVITESMAIKLFGSITAVLGKIVSIDNQLTYEITGVIHDPPPTSHFDIDYLASLSSVPTHHNEPLRTYQVTSWYAHYFHTYIRINENVDPINLDRQIRDAAKYHSNQEDYQLFGQNMGLFLQPLHEIHLNPLRGEIRPQGDKQIIYILGVVALVVLALGSFNYMNLTTALSLKRAKEVGLRKTLGASKKQLVKQFITESIMISLISLTIALTIVQFSLPIFNAQFGVSVDLWLGHNINLFFVVITSALVSGLVGGLYPSFVISSFKPTTIFRGIDKPGVKLSFRKIIVLIQFTISMALISMTYVIYQQVRFMQSASLGISTEEILIIPTNGNHRINSRFSHLKERLRDLPFVEHSTICELSPGDTFGGIVALFEGQTETVSYPTTGVSFDYIKTFDLKIIAGRDFDITVPTDSMERIIINRTLASRLGWTPDEAVGKRYDYGGDNISPGLVIGVMEDFHFNSLRRAIFPIVLAIRPNFYDKIAIRLNTSEFQRSVSEIEGVWSETFPEWPFEYYFANDHFSKQYQSEVKFGGIFFYFSVLALFIGGLGLLGIILVYANFRLKEISIRKILGAKLADILYLQGKEYLPLLFLAFMVSVPLSYYFIEDWLADFAYKLDSYFLFLIFSPFVAIILALTTIFMAGYNSSRANPVEVLRNE